MNRVFRWGEFELDEARAELRRLGEPVPLHGKPYALLAYLVQHANRVIRRAEIERALWPDVVVSNTSLSTALYEVRRALGDQDRRRSSIQTVRGHGYRFSAQVSKHLEPTARLAPPAAPEPDLIGREDVLQQLAEMLDAAERNEARVVLLHGPSGMGKTSVVLRLARIATSRNFDTQMARGHRDEGAPPYWPWIQILRGLAESRGEAALRDAAGTSIDLLVRLIPEVGARLGIQPRAPIPEADQERFQLFDSVATCLTRLARALPLVIILDDLHAADAASLALLLFLARDARNAPLIIAGTYREARSVDTPQEGLLRQLNAQWGTRVIELKGLAPASVEALVGAILGEVAPPALLQQFESWTQGNPFFISEICRALADRPLPDRLSDPRWQLPGSLRESVRARIEELSALTRRLLEATAAIGPRTSLKLLLRVLDADAPTTLRALGEAEDAGFIQHGAESGTYDIQPELFRETLYEDLNTARRAELHRAIGRAFEGLSEGDPNAYLAELSHHFSVSAALDQGEAAVRYGRRAARHAAATFAHEEAAAFLRRALQAHEFSSHPDATLRCELLADLTDALTQASAPLEEVRAVVHETLDLARLQARWDLLGRAARDFAMYSLDQDAVLLWDVARAPLRAPEVQHPIEEALRNLPEHERLLRIRLHLALTALLTQSGDVARAARELSRAQALSDPDDHAWVRLELLLRRCFLLPVVDRVKERLEQCHELTAASLSLGVPVGEALGRATEVALALQCGDRRHAERAAARIERLAEEGSVFFAGELVFAWRGLKAQLDGRFAEAERWGLEGIRFGNRFNYTQERSMAMCALQSWWTQIARGQPGSVLPLWEAYVRTHPGILLARFLLARLYAEAGYLAHARAELEQTDARALETMSPDDNWLFLAACAADVCASVADRERAEPILHLISPYVERVATAGWIGICSGSIARQAGRLYALLGQRSRADELFEHALRQNAGLSSPPLVVWTQYDHARALLELGQRSDAPRIQGLLAAAGRGAEQVGMSTIQAFARMRAG